MNIDSIKNGIVLDHITAGKGMRVYDSLNLDELNCSIAIIKNVKSHKMGKKDIIKIDNDFKVDLDVLGYIDANITISFIKDGITIEKQKLELPKTINNVEICKNPRCITSTETSLKQIFKLVDKEQHVYRCIYCESRIAK
ncbi:MAG: aspartate carbamoyltransferase regulatory subunit [Breznakia sp.]